jgi:trk system potassium uptake protein TrkH
MRNLEVRTIIVTFGSTMLLTLIGLAALGRFAGGTALARQGGFQLLSEHTGTGFATVPSAELASWSGLAFVGIVVAMALGGMGGSTSGGVKSLRVGLAVKALVTSIKEALLPERAVVTTTYHQNGRHRLVPEVARAVLVVTLLSVALYVLGAAVAYAYGYSLESAVFESVSVGAAVGLSVGITAPGMPIPLEVVMIGQMWLGRLEFLAVFSLIGFIISWVVGE